MCDKWRWKICELKTYLKANTISNYELVRFILRLTCVLSGGEKMAGLLHN